VPREEEDSAGYRASRYLSGFGFELRPSASTPRFLHVDHSPQLVHSHHLKLFPVAVDGLLQARNGHRDSGGAPPSSPPTHAPVGEASCRGAIQQV
jgi:hypothetical protein